MASAKETAIPRTVAVIGITFLGLCGLAVYLVFLFAGEERQRDLRAWQTRLGIVAESRVAAVEGWIEAQTDRMASLVENPALRLYMTELSLAEGASLSLDAPYQGKSCSTARI